MAKSMGAVLGGGISFFLSPDGEARVAFPTTVMAGLDPAIHASSVGACSAGAVHSTSVMAWIAGSGPAMTEVEARALIEDGEL